MAKVVVFEDQAGEFRWHKQKGSNIVADSGEGHTDRNYAIDRAFEEADPDDTVVFRDAEGHEEVLQG